MNFQKLKKYFSQELKNTKSIYKQTTQPTKITKYDILKYGYPESRYLRQPADLEIVNFNHEYTKELILSLKTTASENNLFSLSAPQIKKEFRIFCYYKDLSLERWINKDSDKTFNPDNYIVCVNPRIISASDVTHSEYEECGSFELIKTKAKRPLAIVARYQDEKGIIQEREMAEFEARVFCHEYDHILGIPFIHWRVCEGDIIIKDEFITEEDKYENLFYAIDHYKNRLEEAKIHNQDIFRNQADSFNCMNENLGFTHSYRSDINDKKLHFEDVMLMDIEKAIRKDLKLKLKRRTSENILKI